MERLRGVKLVPSLAPMTIGKGGRDGETGDPPPPPSAGCAPLPPATGDVVEIAVRSWTSGPVGRRGDAPFYFIDYVGSTEYIINVIKGAAPGTRWLVGTELNLVNRLAEEVKAEGKIVQFMAPTVCMCSTMQRIDPQHLAWTLENLADGKVVNRITVPEHEAALAKLALERMLAVS